MVSSRVPPSRPSGGPASAFDVYIVGGESLNEPGRVKLAELIAARYRAAAPEVADGLAGGQCLIGKRLAESAATLLAEELRDLGAEVQLQPAGVPLRLVPRRARRLGEDQAADVTRCPLHGLFYDRAQAAGCPRCLQQPARAAERERGDFSSQIKRAFAGLALALLVGLVPAAYYARGVCGVEVARIRARQARLSQEIGTAEITREFDRLDAAVDGVRHRGMRNTAVLWLLVTTITGAAWYKLADGRAG